jgi:hypothetical protein
LQLSGCQQPRAIDTKKKQQDYRYQSVNRNRGLK